MQAFEYASPTAPEEAAKLLAASWGETEVLAGGTDLLNLMKDYIASPKRVVSLQKVKALGGIDFKSGKELRLGAMATLQELVDTPGLSKEYAGLVQAAENISSPQLRAVGTVGGDLLQRPYCWYYRAGFGLLAMQNGKSLVPNGDNRYHAILGNSGPAYFVSPSRLAPMLIALGAKAKVQGPHGAHEMPVEKLFVTPKAAGEREHALKPNEILVEIIVPHPGGAKTAVYDVLQREVLDWPLASAAVLLRMDGDEVKSARVVLGQVAPVPWPSPEAEQVLGGKPVNAGVAGEAGKAALSKATPLSKNGYKVQLARVAVKRAVLGAVGKEA
jgi:xanthine dehydrogenase YagS FAD-binding subunit